MEALVPYLDYVLHWAAHVFFQSSLTSQGEAKLGDLPQHRMYLLTCCHSSKASFCRKPAQGIWWETGCSTRLNPNLLFKGIRLHPERISNLFFFFVISYTTQCYSRCFVTFFKRHVTKKALIFFPSCLVFLYQFRYLSMVIFGSWFNVITSVFVSVSVL